MASLHAFEQVAWLPSTPPSPISAWRPLPDPFHGPLGIGGIQHKFAPPGRARFNIWLDMRAGPTPILARTVSASDQIKGGGAAAMRLDIGLDGTNIRWLDRAVAVLIGYFGGNEAIPVGGAQGGRFARPPATQPDWYPGSLHWARQEGHFAVRLIMFALIVEGLPAHQAREHRQALIQHLGPLLDIAHLAKVHILLVAQPKAQHQTPMREMIQRDRLARQLPRQSRR